MLKTRAAASYVRVGFCQDSCLPRENHDYFESSRTR